MVFRVSALLWCLCLSLSTQAVAAGVDKDAARAKVTEARQQYNLGEFAAALRSYQEVYRMTDDPTLLFNIGQCQWKLGDDRAAIHSYRAYLRSGKDVANRAQTEARVLELEKKLRELDAAKPGAVEPTSPSDPAKPEPSAAETSKPTMGAEVKPAETKPTEPKPAEANPSPTPAPLPAAPVATTPEQPAGVVLVGGATPEATERHPFYTRWWFWTAVGVVAAGGVALALAMSSGGTSSPSCPAGASCDR